MWLSVMIPLLCIILLWCSQSRVSTTATASASQNGAESHLISDLLANYSRHGRPISDVSKAVTVHIALYLTQLMSLDERNQVLTTFGWLETYWTDDFLQWDAEDYDGLTHVVLSPELVWLPDFGVENSAKAIYEELFYKRFRVSVRHDGIVNWVPGGKFVTSCQLDITYYPFDEQQCHIDLVDWAYNGKQVELINSSNKIGLDAYRESGEWSITETLSTSEDLYFESDPGIPFPRIRFTLRLKRKPMFYTINIVTPCITMSLLALLVFYLPPDSGEKVSLGITVLLSFSVFLLLVADNVPKTSEFVPLLGIYLTLIMGMTTMSIIISVIVLNLHNRDPAKQVPKWLRHLTHNCMSYIVCVRSPATRRHSGVRHGASDQAEFSIDTGDCSRNYDENYTESQYLASDLEESNLCDHRQYLEDNVHQTAGVLEEIVTHLRQITNKLVTKEEQYAIKSEWKEVAKILDRFFLMAFVILVFSSTFLLLVLYPLSSNQFQD